MKIAITTDHAGLACDGLYTQVQGFLASPGHEMTTCGPRTLDMDDDYPGTLSFRLPKP